MAEKPWRIKSRGTFYQGDKLHKSLKLIRCCRAETPSIPARMETSIDQCLDESLFRLIMSQKLTPRGKRDMHQLTIRGFDDDLSRRIRQLANQEGISLNRAVLRLLRRGAGLEPGKPGTDIVGSSLDHLIGTWTHEEAVEMDRAIRDLSQIDGGMWE